MTVLGHIGPVPVEELLPLIALASSGGLVAVASGRVRGLVMRLRRRRQCAPD